MPEFKRDFKDYIKFDIGAMGEFDVAVLIEQYAGKELSKRCIRSGGADITTRRARKTMRTAPLGLLYVSRWSSAEKAAEFAEIYARSLGQRYKKAEEVERSLVRSIGSTHPKNKVDVLKGRHAGLRKKAPW